MPHIREDPCTRRAVLLVKKPVERINKVVCHHFPNTSSEAAVAMEQNVVAKQETVCQPVVRDRPFLCHGRHDVHVVIEGYKGVIQLVTRPDVRLVLGIYRVESKQSRRLVIFKNLMARVGRFTPCTRERQHDRKQIT